MSDSTTIARACEGIAHISGLVGALHERFPGFRFTLAGGVIHTGLSTSPRP